MPFNYFTENPSLVLADFDACPFCGKTITVEREDGVKMENWEGEFTGIWNVECEECDTSLGPFVSPTHASLVWNNRKGV